MFMPVRQLKRRRQLQIKMGGKLPPQTTMHKGGKGLSVINHLLIYLIRQGPAACRHLSLGLGERAPQCRVHSAPPERQLPEANLRMRGIKER